MSPDLPPLLSVELLAPLLGVTPNAVRGMIRRGTIPASRLGRSYVIRREALVAVLQRGERAHRPPTDSEADVTRLLRALPPPRHARDAVRRAPEVHRA